MNAFYKKIIFAMGIVVSLFIVSAYFVKYNRYANKIDPCEEKILITHLKNLREPIKVYTARHRILPSSLKDTELQKLVSQKDLDFFQSHHVEFISNPTSADNQIYIVDWTKNFVMSVGR